MEFDDGLGVEFERHRARLHGLAYRMLGSTSDADDAVQEAWLRLSRTEAQAEGKIDNLGGWLTTVVARLSLNQVRARTARREAPLELYVPDPVVRAYQVGDPAEEAATADAVSLALLVVLETLDPAARLAFVLHDVFAVPFEQIAALLERSPAAVRQLASRARRRVQASAPQPDGLPAQREVVDAFFAAARGGDLARLIAVLHPDVVLVADPGSAAADLPRLVTGAGAVAARARMFARDELRVLPALVNGTAGVVIMAAGHPVSVMAFTVIARRVQAIHALSDPDRLRVLDLALTAAPDEAAGRSASATSGVGEPT